MEKLIQNGGGTDGGGIAARSGPPFLAVYAFGGHWRCPWVRATTGSPVARVPSLFTGREDGTNHRVF